MAARGCRYQAAIVDGDRILLVRHRDRATGDSYWILPGGGHIAPETEAACVAREVLEETHLEVEIQRLLIDQVGAPDDPYYASYKTYLCRIVAGEPRAGAEPEAEHHDVYEIAEAAWWSLSDPSSWDPLITNDAHTSLRLHALRDKLGFA